MDLPPKGYSSERNVQILVALLKAYGVRWVVASPGTTNINFLWSLQQDSFFRLVSAADERHGAYLACGLAAETGEAVVLTCTGATASRNYLPALTEAYYRKLPILAVTSSQDFSRVGNLVPQVIDRRTPPRDTVRYATAVAIPRDVTAERACELEVNRALVELWRHGGGPVHINLETHYSRSFDCFTLPPVRKIEHLTLARQTAWPELRPGQRVAVWVGNHRPIAAGSALEAFVRAFDAVVFVDHTSGYAGPGAVHASLLLTQGGFREAFPALQPPEVLIHIGEVSGDYPAWAVPREQTQVWRVSEDGELRDLFGKLTAVFEMPEEHFFRHYAQGLEAKPLRQAEAWQAAVETVRAQIPELPFSNPWIAQQLSQRLPAGSRLHLGILNSLRSWNLFPIPEGVLGASNTGGFGIDGCLSTLIGASLASPERLFFLVIGDLAFFYDLNALGNRALGKNVRILLVNNAAGGEFHIYNHPGAAFGEASGPFIAADGHYGNHSRALVRHYAEDLGLRYLAAEDKASLEAALETFLAPAAEQSMVLECFTKVQDESDAQELLNTLYPASGPSAARRLASAVLPHGVKSALKRVLK